MLMLWSEADQWPHAKEAFAREIYRRGEISLDERNRMIKGAWNDPALNEAARLEAASKIEFVFREHVPTDKLKAVLPALREMAGSDIGIALGDEIERRHGAHA